MQVSKNRNLSSIFDQIVLCRDCKKVMQLRTLNKEGFNIRYLVCPKCGKKIMNENDLNAYREFKQLRKKVFAVKLRMVGNSYIISLPKEIIKLLQETKQIHDQMVKIMLEEINKLKLLID